MADVAPPPAPPAAAPPAPAPVAAPALTDDTKAKVVKQLEFYFSDSNLPKDKFLRAQAEAHPDGLVDLSLLLSFSRMRALLGLGAARADEIPDDLVLAVAEAVRQRGTGALAVGETGFQVKRATPLPAAKDAARAVDARSAYARPFPRDATIDAITAFLNERLAPAVAAGANANGDNDASAPKDNGATTTTTAVNCVRLRRHPGTKDFKGSAFVEFSSKEALDAALALASADKAAVAEGGDADGDNAPLTYEGAPLRLEAKQAYLTRKIAERKAAAAKAAADGLPPLPPLTLQALEEADSEDEGAAAGPAWLRDVNAGVDLASLPPAPPAPKADGDGPASKRARQEDNGDGQNKKKEGEGWQPPQPLPGCLVRVDLERKAEEGGAEAEKKKDDEAEKKEEAEADAEKKDEEEAKEKEEAAPTTTAQVDARALREALGGRQNGVQYVEVAPGATDSAVTCFVRYASPDAAKAALTALAERLEQGKEAIGAGAGWRAARAAAADADEERLFQERAAAGRAAAEARRGEGGGGNDRKRRFDGPQGGRGGGRGRFGGGGGRGGGGRFGGGGRGRGGGGRGGGRGRGRGGGGRGRGGGN